MELLILFISILIEGFLFAGTGLSIIGIRLDSKNLVFISCINSLAIYGVRTFYKIYKIPLGTHSFVIILLFIAILKFIGKQKLSTSIIAILISFLLVSVGEGILMYNVFKVFNITMEDLFDNSFIRLMGTIISDIPLIIVFIIGYIFKISIIDINSFSEKEEI
ncbi:hypothetical protein [Paramaledivibacter caminithermalis]|uniref:Uncharacterized protein n=1 Tax=Paramaledivibacter caminithermalis (strain DSM 15212 / CIP 107654 / DViRD3) TaxID=1121301 RepID=A0A1M6RPX9_PARC5|nr:hypothetical protein [Paramaledivibacter caminithermalis]SHK34377.1 hypothetical protein SAMN02745912_03036 [Paramaledivibacter caminithermalis DSM 15212]